MTSLVASLSVSSTSCVVWQSEQMAAFALKYIALGARVVGPTEGVAKVKAVAQLEAEFKDVLRAQLAVIRPKLICALGTFAAQTLLRTREPISRLRGRLHAYEGIPLLPTFHPAYLLRNPHEKRTVWEDMKLLQKEYRRLTAKS